MGFHPSKSMGNDQRLMQKRWPDNLDGELKTSRLDPDRAYDGKNSEFDLDELSCLCYESVQKLEKKGLSSFSVFACFRASMISVHLTVKNSLQKSTVGNISTRPEMWFPH